MIELGDMSKHTEYADFLKPFEHLYLFAFIPDHFLRASRVCAGRNYLLTGDLGQDKGAPSGRHAAGVRGAQLHAAQLPWPQQRQQPQQQRQLGGPGLAPGPGAQTTAPPQLLPALLNMKFYQQI